MVPGIEALENGIYTLITAMRQPEVNHRVISHKLAFLYEALEVNVLVDTLPMREQGEGHELDLVQTLISRADESIRTSPRPGPAPPEVNGRRSLTHAQQDQSTLHPCRSAIRSV